MNRIYKKEYNVLLRSFISRAFFGIIIVSSLFACKGVSKEDLEEVEKRATEEVKGAKEETEKVKKELEDKITVLEGRAPASIIDATQYANIQKAVGLDVDGNLDYTVMGTLADQVDGLDQNVTTLDQSVLEINKSIKAVRTALGMNIADDNIEYKHGLAKSINDMHTFIEGIKLSVGLANNGAVNNASGLSEGVEAIKTFIAGLKNSIGLDNVGGLMSKGLVQDVETLKTNTAAMSAKIVKGVNTLAGKLGDAANNIELTDL